MRYEIAKAVSYIVYDEDGELVNEFADYDEAYRWVQEMKEIGGGSNEG